MIMSDFHDEFNGTHNFTFNNLLENIHLGSLTWDYVLGAQEFDGEVYEDLGAETEYYNNKNSESEPIQEAEIEPKEEVALKDEEDTGALRPIKVETSVSPSPVEKDDSVEKNQLLRKPKTRRTKAERIWGAEVLWAAGGLQKDQGEVTAGDMIEEVQGPGQDLEDTMAGEKQDRAVLTDMIQRSIGGSLLHLHQTFFPPMMLYVGI